MVWCVCVGGERFADGGGWSVVERVEAGDGTATDLSVPGHAVQELRLADNDNGEHVVRSVRPPPTPASAE